MSSSYRKEEHRSSDRHSSSGRDRDRRDNGSDRRRRSRTPDSSPERQRDPNELPTQFGRDFNAMPKDTSSSNVLQRMKTMYALSPLQQLTNCLDGSHKIKVWTRNYKQVRGICSGYVVAFDNHWNLVLTDVDESYLKVKRPKTPFLEDASPRDFDELPKKTPKQKKTAAAEGEEQPAVEKPMETEPASEGEVSSSEKAGKKKRKKRQRRTTTFDQRHLKQVFIRGDNIVMIAIMDDEEEEEEKARIDGMRQEEAEKKEKEKKKKAAAAEQKPAE